MLASKSSTSLRSSSDLTHKRCAYLVVIDEPTKSLTIILQQHIDFALTSPFGGARAGRVKRKREAAAASKDAGGDEEEEE